MCSSDLRDRVHALFLFLSLLELSQQKYMRLVVGEGRNNFIIEWNENREEEPTQPELSNENFGDFDPSLN